MLRAQSANICGTAMGATIQRNHLDRRPPQPNKASGRQLPGGPFFHPNPGHADILGLKPDRAHDNATRARARHLCNSRTYLIGGGASIQADEAQFGASYRPGDLPLFSPRDLAHFLREVISLGPCGRTPDDAEGLSAQTLTDAETPPKTKVIEADPRLIFAFFIISAASPRTAITAVSLGARRQRRFLFLCRGAIPVGAFVVSAPRYCLESPGKSPGPCIPLLEGRY